MIAAEFRRTALQPVAQARSASTAASRCAGADAVRPLFERAEHPRLADGVEDLLAETAGARVLPVLKLSERVFEFPLHLRGVDGVLPEDEREVVVRAVEQFQKPVFEFDVEMGSRE